MGREIVYCQGCGRRLTEPDFEKRKAQRIGHEHWCSNCRDLPEVPPARTPKSGTRRPSGSRNALPAATPRTPSRAAPAVPAASKKTLFLFAGGVVVGILVVAVALSGGGSPAPPPTPSKPPATDRAGQALQDLERFAATRPPPEALLARIDAARAAVAGSRHEERLRRLEALAREQLAKTLPVAPQDRLTPFLKEIRVLIDKDETLARKNDVLSMLDSAARIAGDRGGEVAALRAFYEGKLRDAGKPAEILLLPDAARRTGPTLHVSKHEDIPMLAGFNGDANRAEWTAEIPRAGRYAVELDHAVGAFNGGEFTLSCGPSEIRGVLGPTGSWTQFETKPLGTLTLPAGHVTIALRPLAVTGGLMNLRRLRLAWTGP